MTIDMKLYNGLVVRIAALGSASRQLTPEAQLTRWESFMGILIDAIDGDVMEPVMDLMNQTGHGAWNPTVKKKYADEYFWVSPLKS
jgi:hypothetical protein